VAEVKADLGASEEKRREQQHVEAALNPTAVRLTRWRRLSPGLGPGLGSGSGSVSGLGSGSGLC